MNILYFTFMSFASAAAALLTLFVRREQYDNEAYFVFAARRLINDRDDSWCRGLL